jgi:pSer/pThr/pTyr-binding forkhead associated (FHA) protein
MPQNALAQTGDNLSRGQRLNVTTQSKYWCDKGLVITVVGPDGRRRIEVDKPFARLGSHNSSEVVIPDKRISRRRFYFHATDDGVFCVNLSHLKTAVDQDRGWLNPNHAIKMGPYRVSAQLAGHADAPPPSETRPDLEARETAAQPRPVLAMSIEGKEVAEREVRRQLTVIGRRIPSTLRITSYSVSSTHCVLYWDSRLLWVVDLFSANGTRLHGRRVDAAQFPPGETLKVGRAELLHLAVLEDLQDYDDEDDLIA